MAAVGRIYVKASGAKKLIILQTELAITALFFLPFIFNVQIIFGLHINYCKVKSPLLGHNDKMKGFIVSYTKTANGLLY